MPTSNKAMSNLIRKEREGLSSYMYGGDEKPAVTVAKVAPADEMEGLDEVLGSLPEDIPLPDDVPTEEAFTVLAAGEAPDPEMYVYELSSEAPGAWMIYPPGVPCDSGSAKIQTSSPASAAQLAEMETALLDAEGLAPSTPAIEGAY